MSIVLLQTPVSRAYQMTAGSVIAKVRYLIQDKDLPYRTSDSELFGWINDAISSLVALVPQQFTKIGTHACVASARQTLSNSRAHSLVDVVGVHKADLLALTAFSPNWQNAPAGPIVNWLRPIDEPLSFYCYPPSPEGQSLQVMYIELPATIVATGDVIPLPETYEPAIVAYVTSLAQSKDDEAIDMQRAQQFMVDFVGRVKGS